MDIVTAYKIAKSYLTDNVTMETLADTYGVSKTTIIRLLNGEGSVVLDDDILSQIAKVKLDRAEKARHRKTGKRAKLISPETARSMAMTMIKDGLTLADLHTEGGPSIGTIYNSFTLENLGPELYEKVIGHYAMNRSQATRNCPNNKLANDSKTK